MHSRTTPQREASLQDAVARRLPSGRNSAPPPFGTHHAHLRWLLLLIPLLGVLSAAATSNAGGSWSAWSTASVSVSGAFGAMQTLQGAPQGLTATPGAWTNVNSFTVTWTNPPDIGSVAGAWYKLDQPPASANDGIFVATTNTISGITVSTDGAHPIYVWLQDATGHADHTASASTTLHLDRIAPSPPFGLVGNPARTWINVNDFSETWINPADPSGITGVYYRLDQPGVFPTDGTFVSTTNSLADIIVPGDGKHDLYLWLLDGAGNVSHLNRNVDPQVFWYDGTAPTATATLASPLPANGWYSSTVNITFTGSDLEPGSGLDAVYHQLDAGPWSTTATADVNTEGAHKLTYYAQDLAGNHGSSSELELKLDMTPPTVTLIPARLPEASDWYTAAITLTLNATDSLSGGATGYYRLNDGPWQAGTSFTLTTQNVYFIDYYGQDAAGNRSAVGSTQVRVDATPPATAYLIEGVQGDNGWFKSPLNIKLVPSDSGSGVAATYYQINGGPWQSGAQFQLTADGSYTLLFYSIDAAGNVEGSFPVQVKIDSTVPAAPTALVTIPAEWSQINRFAVQWANPTDLSGIAGVYYKLDQEPTNSQDGTFLPLTNRLEGLTVPSEGAHQLYLWLRDSAGNSDHRNRASAPLLRYDASPPVTQAEIQGLAGTEGWYRSAVNVVLRANDAHSSVAALRYRLNDTDWITATASSVTVPITEADKHILEFGSEDIAGNIGPTQLLTVRIDPTAPPAPSGARAEPVGWHRYNNFRLSWRAPLDQSGIGGVYVRFATPPTRPDDGVFYPASDLLGVESLEGLQAPAEGRHSVYIWLRDRAGNADHTTAVALIDALWYDGTPPVTTVTHNGQLGSGGWYVAPVTFSFTAVDETSGVAETRYQINTEPPSGNDEPWTTGDSLSLTMDGVYTVRIGGVDNAGNVEPAQVFRVPLDQTAPVARFSVLSRHQLEPQFTVAWTGNDPPPGSGLASFDVQVRDGYDGTWQAWHTNTQLTSATFDGERGHTYFFRIAARDVAGNLKPFTDDPDGMQGGQVFTTVDTVLNGSFETGAFASWSASGLLRKAVVPMTGPTGASVLGARLGSEDYGPSLSDPGQVPVDNAAISQILQVPNSNQVRQPTLAFWYRVFTYDVKYSQRLQRYVDTFDVTLYDLSGQLIAQLLRDGNPTQDYGTLYDTGWKRALIDLSPYAGQTVQLVFANYNRHDNLFNTWSYLDDVQVREGPFSYRLYLPATIGQSPVEG